MMRFDAIVEIGDGDIQEVYRELTASTLATALKKASPEVADKFFRNMPSDMAAMIQELMEKLDEVSGEQVEAQRAKILNVIDALQSQGKIGPQPL